MTETNPFITPTGFQLNPHQINAKKWILTPKASIKGKKGGFLCLSMGLGKTLTAIFATVGDRKPEYGGTLVICPLSVLSTWKQEIAKFYGSTLKVIVAYPKNEIEKYSKQQLFEADLVLTTYETIQTLAYHKRNEFAPRIVDSILEVDGAGKVHDVENAKFPSADKDPLCWEERLFSIRWRWKVFDESQRVGNYNTKTWRGSMAIWSRYTLHLSGTPVMNDVKEYYTQFRLLGYDDCTRTQWGKNTAKYIKEDGLEECIYSRSYKDVGIKLPGIESICVPVKLSEEERRVYDKVVEMIRIEYGHFVSGKDNASIVLGMFVRLRQLSLASHIAIINSEDKFGTGRQILELMDSMDLGSWIRDSGGTAGKMSSKLNKAFEILHQIPSDEKFIVFSSFTHPILLLESRLDEEFSDLHWVYIDGSVKGEERDKLITKFQTDPKIRGMLITNKTGSTGLNLSCANHIIFLDEWWNDATNEQGIHRSYRVGQTKVVKIYLLPVMDSIEQRVRDICERKTEAISKLSSATTTLSKYMKLL